MRMFDKEHNIRGALALELDHLLLDSQRGNISHRTKVLVIKRHRLLPKLLSSTSWTFKLRCVDWISSSCSLAVTSRSIGQFRQLLEVFLRVSCGRQKLISIIDNGSRI